MAVIGGTDGNDVPNGTPQNDQIRGLSGDDILRDLARRDFPGGRFVTEIASGDTDLVRNVEFLAFDALTLDSALIV